jgi:AcrR family transcriptional regulator
MASRTPKPPAVLGNNKYHLRQAKVLSYSAKVIAREGFEKASIRRIAAEMGMSISALYYYYKSKDDLLFSIQYTSFEELVGELEAKLDGVKDPEHRLYLLIENHIEHFANRLNELIICSHEINTLKGKRYEVVRTFRRRYYNVAFKIVEEIKNKRKGCVLKSSMATLNLFGMLNWIYMWFDPKKDKSPRALAEEIYNLFLNGIKSRNRKSPRRKIPAS